ncbi:MAG: hypothetical protein KatS3mg086_022 [Candidatus Dojkabacteria bacterium]|nr:MAG: hypothetical protein KatS3mg086_022 [Candidatus Dojkabacteria bacterium]
MVKHKNQQTLFFPSLEKYLHHGISWNAPNMSYKFESTEIVKKNIENFLMLNKVDSDKNKLHLLCEHKDNIIFVDKRETVDKNSFFNSDCLITNSSQNLIFVKPADCAISIIYAKNKKDEFVTIMHAGRSGIDLELPKKTIKFLIEKLKVTHESIKIGISPMISKEHYFILQKDSNLIRDINEWKNFINFKNKKIFLDLKGYLLKQFYDCGIKEFQIHDSNLDTFTNAKLGKTFSHRFSKMYNEKDGRMLIFAGLR